MDSLSGSKSRTHEPCCGAGSSPAGSQRPESPFQAPPPHPEEAGLLATLQAVWPAMTALFLAGNLCVIVFPFFTYIPSSGWLGSNLPTVGA